MALKRIVLRDFVIVQQLDLELSSRFTALTGETGAGKSILIDALQLALGARADAGVVREGAQRTEVSAEFDGIAGLQPWLELSGFDTADTLLLRRMVTPDPATKVTAPAPCCQPSICVSAGHATDDCGGTEILMALAELALMVRLACVRPSVVLAVISTICAPMPSSVNWLLAQVAFTPEPPSTLPST